MSTDQFDRCFRDMQEYARTANKSKRNDFKIYTSAAQLANHFGIRIDRQGLWWNALIDALDNYRNDWRGYPAPKSGEFRECVDSTL